MTEQLALCSKCNRQLLGDGQCLYCTTTDALDLHAIVSESKLSPPPQEHVLTLMELDGGRRFTLDTARARIGRDPKNQICLDDVYVSKQHAFITYEEGRYWLEDLGSKNGTKLNGAHILDREVLSRGDIVTIGRSDFRVE
jgi:pSer/pThr/pTyr-binding forkhead associated (FHA) protein